MSDETTLVIKRWKWNPELFFTEALGVEPSNQQREGLRAVAELVEAKWLHGEGQKLTKRQAELAKKIGLSIASGHNCHGAGTRVMMYDGSTKAVEDVEEGDLLMGDDETEREVLELYRGEDELYRVEYPDGESYDVNSEHSLCLVATQSHGKQKVGEINEVPMREYVKKSNRWKRTNVGYRVGIKDWPYYNHNLQIPPYVLGIWLGDGAEKHTTLFGIDPEPIAAWKAWGDSLGLKYRKRSDKEHHLNNLWNNHGLKLFRHYSLIGNKHIPKQYMFAPLEDRRELLAGLIDTDGYLEYTGIRFSIIQKRRHLAEQIVFLARSLGHHATIREKNKSWSWNGEKKAGTYYEVGITRGIHDIPTRIPRKRAQKSERGRKLHFNFSVRSMGKGKYYGFEVDGNHRYLLSDFTVTRNTGKDKFLAGVYLWFLTCFPYAKGLVTGPNFATLKSVLWHEFRKITRTSTVRGENAGWLTQLFEIQHDKLIHKHSNGESYVEARTANVKGSSEEQGEALAGRHEKYLLLSVDEASGVPDGVFRPLEGAMAGRVNFAILIGNMTRNSGYFYDTHYKHQDFWVTLRWDTEMTNLDEVSKGETKCQALVNFYERKYGRDSNAFRVRIKGLPPTSDADALIPRDWVMRAIGRDVRASEFTPLAFGVDVAYSGDDDSTIIKRRGPEVYTPRQYHGIDNMALVGWVAREYSDEKPEHIFVDTIGIGHGVWSRLREMSYPVHAVVVSEKADDERYGNKRNELWWRVREAFEAGAITLPECRCHVLGEDKFGGICVNCQLVEELSAQKCHPPNSAGQIRVLSKKEMKKLGYSSPNLADALCLTYAMNLEYAPDVDYDPANDGAVPPPVCDMTGY